MVLVLSPTGRVAGLVPRRASRQTMHCPKAKLRARFSLTVHSSLRIRRIERIAKPKKSSNTELKSFLGMVMYASPSQDFFEAAINSLVVGSGMICFALAFVPLLTYSEESEAQMEPDDLDTVKWSVAGAVSCFPYLNWTSWLLIAFDSDRPNGFYFLSALYLMPFLKSGLDFGPLSVFMYVLGILHMQVERVAQTEPSMLNTMAEDKPELANIITSIPSLISKVVPGQSEQAESFENLVDKEYKKQEQELRDAEKLADIEQQFWDKKFNEDR